MTSQALESSVPKDTIAPTSVDSKSPINNQHTAGPAQPTRFEGLPAEIRHNIYSYLGYPVGAHLYQDCKGGDDCKFKSHIVFHEDEHGPMKAHAVTGVFENRVRVAQMKLFGRSEMDSPFNSLCCMDSPFTSLCCFLERSVMVCNPFSIDLGLLGVNKLIRDELLGLLFNNIDIWFNYPMLDQAVYSKPQIPNSLPCHHMRLLPSTLAYMTSVSYQPYEYSVRSDLPVLELDANTFKFFAKHCPHLRSFTFHPRQAYMEGCLEGDIGSLSQAMQKLVRACRKLDTLKIVYCIRVMIPDDGVPYHTSSGEVVEELTKEDMAMVAAWSWKTLMHIQGGAIVYDD